MHAQSYQVDESMGGDGLGGYIGGADANNVRVIITKEGMSHLTEEQIEGIEKIKRLKQASAVVTAPEETHVSDVVIEEEVEEVKPKVVEKSSSDVDNKGVQMALIVVGGIVSIVLIYGAYCFYIGKAKGSVSQPAVGN